MNWEINYSVDELEKFFKKYGKVRQNYRKIFLD